MFFQLTLLSLYACLTAAGFAGVASCLMWGFSSWDPVLADSDRLYEAFLV